jgi:putative oxidoreductase
MKVTNLIINVLVGLAYTVFGANFFFNFIPMPPMTGDPATFIGVLASTGFMTVVKVLEIVGGLMLLTGVQRPLGYVILMPITVVIAMFEIFIAKQPAIGILLFLLLSFLIWSNRERFMPIVAKA